MNWDTSSFSEICQINIGGTPSRGNPEYWGGNNPWVSISDMRNPVVVSTNECITDKGVRKSNAKLVEEGTLLMSFKLSLGKVAIAGIPLFTNEAIAALPIKDKNKINSRFLFYALQVIDWKGFGKRAVKGNCLNKDILEDVPISYPSLVEQERIVSILDKAQRLRDRHFYIQDLSDTFMYSLFLQMFGDLQRENRWEFKSLSSIAEVVSGVAKGQKYNGKQTVTVPYLRVANVQDGYLDLREIKHIEALPSDVEFLKLEEGDVLMTEGGDFDKLGRGAIWHNQIENCIHQNHIFRVRPSKKTVLPKFFASYLLTPFAKSYFLRCAKQTTNLASINMTQLKDLPVPVPPSPLQETFIQSVERFGHTQFKQREASRQAEHLFETLLNRAFRGEL